MRLLDLYCGAGGAAVGYHRAGFTDIVGVDNRPQPQYPFTFVQADALEYVAAYGVEFDLIHASPPCQFYTVIKSLHEGRVYPDLILATRLALDKTEVPYIIENVPGAPLVNPLTLCGTMFGLKLIRHRLFECSTPVWFAPFACSCASLYTGSHRGFSSFANGATAICVAGHNFLLKDGRVAMGIDWMSSTELAQAIPPCYTEWLGGQMLKRLS